MTYNEAVTKLKDLTLNPSELAEIRQWLGAEYGFCADRMGEILMNKPVKWLEIRSRKDIRSDSQADKIWEGTTEGREEIMYRWKMKGLEKMLSAINSRLRTFETEAKNQF